MIASTDSVRADSFPDEQAFLRLNVEMKVHQLFALVHHLERTFSQESGFNPELVQLLGVWLAGCGSSADPDLQQLSKLLPKISANMTYKHFAGLVVPFERLYNRSVIDPDFLVVKGDATKARKILPVILILDNIRSAMNVGSIFRTAECLGAAEIYLCGYTAPADHEKVLKCAMGTSSLVSSTFFQRTEDAIACAREKGHGIVAIETCPQGQPVATAVHGMKAVAVLLGNERHGLDERSLSLADGVAMIPMLGQKNSLNVAVAVGIVLHELTQIFDGC